MWMKVVFGIFVCFLLYVMYRLGSEQESFLPSDEELHESNTTESASEEVTEEDNAENVASKSPFNLSTLQWIILVFLILRGCAANATTSYKVGYILSAYISVVLFNWAKMNLR